MFFFFKQKTAYEMRISDWSSDVCSSDLQFDPEDRQTAYDFVKHRLVFISSAEMQRAIEAFFPETVTPLFRRLAAEQAGIPPHELWGNAEGVEAFDRILRRTLFFGLSEGSRIDILRRANAGRIPQEQVVPMINIDDEKWKNLGEKIVERNAEDEKFEHVFLIDDFTASGTTFIRQVKGKWKGKLQRFNAIVDDARKRLGGEFPIAENYAIHHKPEKRRVGKARVST